MKRLAGFVLTGLLMFPSFAAALSVDEIIRLKRAGVADSTIELMIERNAQREKSAGIVRHDGWIVHTTDTHKPQPVWGDSYETSYPIAVYPWVRGARRR